MQAGRKEDRAETDAAYPSAQGMAAEWQWMAVDPKAKGFVHSDHMKLESLG